jgi:hypothetical protein
MSTGTEGDRDLLQKLISKVQADEEQKQRIDELERKFDEAEERRRSFRKEWDGDGPDSDGWRDKIKQQTETHDKYGGQWPRVERFIQIMDAEETGETGNGMDWLHYAKELRRAKVLAEVNKIKWAIGVLSAALPTAMWIYTTFYTE